MGKESEEYYWYGAADGNLDYYLIAGEYAGGAWQLYLSDRYG